MRETKSPGDGRARRWERELLATEVSVLMLALVLALLAIPLALSLVHEGKDAKSC